MIQRNFIDCIGSEKDFESLVYFLKMKADFLRYKSQVATEETVDACLNEVSNVYGKAYDIDIHPGSPIRLGMIYNYCIFLADSMKNKPEAIKFMERAISDA